MKLFKRDGLYGIKEGKMEFVPPYYEDPKDAIYEWKCFEVENSNRKPHRKFLPSNKTLEEINQIEESLLNSIE